MRQQTALFGIVISFIISGCASLSKEECALANWDAIGYGDGSRGEPAGRFNTHQKACAEHGFSADFATYQTGHQRAVEEVFCKPRNAYQQGLRGAVYHNVCPAHLEREFLAAYQDGRDINQMQHAYNELHQQSTKLKSKVVNLDKQIATLNHDIQHADAPSPAARVQDLRRERHETESLYHRMEKATSLAQQSAELLSHLRHELSNQNQRVQRAITRFSSQPDMSARERQATRTLASLSVENGQIKSQILWINSNPKTARTRQQQTAILQRQLQQLAPKISKAKNDLHPHRPTPQDKRRLQYFMEQAEYEGMLNHHTEILNHLRDQSTLNLLIDVHFQAELVNLDKRIDEARHASPPPGAQGAYRQLHDAEQQRDDYLYRLDDLEQQMRAMQRDIDHLKSTNHY